MRDERYFNSPDEARDVFHKMFNDLKARSLDIAREKGLVSK